MTATTALHRSYIKGGVCQRLTSRACRRKVLFSDLAHSMHSKHSSTSWPVAASISKNISSRERTNRAAFALLMEFRNGRTYFSRPPSSADKLYMGNDSNPWENWQMTLEQWLYCFYLMPCQHQNNNLKKIIRVVT